MVRRRLGGVARRGAVSIRSEARNGGHAERGLHARSPLAVGAGGATAQGVTADQVQAKVKYALPGDVAADVRKAFIGTAYMREKMVATSPAPQKPTTESATRRRCDWDERSPTRRRASHRCAS